MNSDRIRKSAFLCVAVLATGIGAQKPASSGSPSVQTNISTSGSTGIEPAFAGFNVALMDTALSYTDPRLMTLAKHSPQAGFAIRRAHALKRLIGRLVKVDRTGSIGLLGRGTTRHCRTHCKHLRQKAASEWMTLTH
jgi:hypothetical protein